MTKADSVHSTPPTNTPVDTTRRRFITIAAGASIVSVGSLVAAAAIPATANVTSDPAFALIAEKPAADVAHGEACDALSEAENRYGVGSEEAEDLYERGGPACDAAMEACWPLATTPPTTLAGVAAVLRFANEVEDAGMEWPNTDTVGPDGWHYQLRATIAAAIEALIKVQAGKAVQS